MKILFNDILADCIVSANNTDTNFPTSNLAHPFLRRRWQSTTNTDTITIEAPFSAEITGVYLSYTNATSASIVIYGLNTIGYGGEEIGFNDGDIVGINSQDAGVAIPIVEAVHVDSLFSKIELTLTAPVGEKLYLGKVALGIESTIDPPESFWQETFEDKSIISISEAGQVLQEFNEPLRVWQFNFPTLDRDETRALQDSYRQTGVGKPIFVDPMTDDLPVLYCRLSNPMSSDKNKRQYKTNLNFIEAR